jgi:hypothetical protein
VLDRSRALQILGLSEGADESEISAAYRALRGHVEARARAEFDEAKRAARKEELRDLERAWRALSALPAPAGVIQPTRALKASKPVPRWVLGWAVIVTLLAAGLVVRLATSDGAFGPRVLVDGGVGGEDGSGDGGFAIDGEGGDDADASGGSPTALDAGARAKLVADSEIEGAVLEVRTRGDASELVAEGAADESVYWLSPGSYSLEVSHADCGDTWAQDVDVTGDEDLKLDPEICKEMGWMMVRSNVADDELSIDGERKGPTSERKYPVPTGEHEVRVEKKGYQAWEGIVEVEPGQLLGIRPRLEPVAKARKPRPKRERPQVASAPAEADEASRDSFKTWHEDARSWLLSRYDLDRSGALDSMEELSAVPCDHWLGLEQSYDQSNLGLSLTRFYGFDGNGWRSGALGVADEARDLAYERMKACGLRH